MNGKLSLKFRIGFTTLVTLLIWGHIAWDYFHEGIPVHYLLHDKDLPGIPNWWGGIALPFFTWFLLYRIHKRADGQEMPDASENLASIGVRFFLAMGIAIAISVFFTFGIDVIDYIMLAILVLAFIYPLYKSEYLLGWIMGSSFTFGAIIPIAFGSLLALIFYVLYKITRIIIRYVRPKSQ